MQTEALNAAGCGEIFSDKASGAKAGGGGGRKPALTPRKLDTARKLLAAGDKPKDIAATLQVSVATFYRYFPAGDREAA